MPAKKYISPADHAYGHFNKFGAVVIDRIEPEPEPEEPEEPVPLLDISISDLPESFSGLGKSRAMVNLSEDYTIWEDRGGRMVRSDSKGNLILANLGATDRLYDIFVSLKNTGASSLPNRPVDNLELQPRTQAVMEYDIGDSRNLLDITEKITTHPESDDPEEIMPNHLLVAGAQTKVLFEIKVVNASGHRVSDLEVRKEIPESFHDYGLGWIQETGGRLTGADGLGKASVKGSEIVWNIGSLGAGNQAVIRFTLMFTPVDVDPKPTGYIKAAYTVNRNLSGVAVNEYGAMSKNIYSLNVEEVNEPGFWNCSMEFRNISEFPVLLTRAYVARADTDTVFLDIRDHPPLLQPDTMWESNSWQIKDADRPKLMNLVHFRVMPEVLSSSRVNVIKEEASLTIASLAGLKSYDKTSIPSFAETDIRTLIVLQNQGTGSLNELTIRDTMPAPMRPPETKDVVVRWNDVELPDTAYSLAFTPNDYDHTKDHILAVSLVNLKDNRGTFDPGDKVTVEYTVRAIRPEPETTMKGKVIMVGRGHPAGDSIITQIPQEALPTVHVEHSLRKYTIGKAVEPVGDVGSYSVELQFINQGKTTLRDMFIIDPVPRGFTVENSRPEGAELVDRPERALVWRFEEIKPGTRMTFRYLLVGSGEYNPAEAQVSFGS